MAEAKSFSKKKTRRAGQKLKRVITIRVSKMREDYHSAPRQLGQALKYAATLDARDRRVTKTPAQRLTSRLKASGTDRAEAVHTADAARRRKTEDLREALVARVTPPAEEVTPLRPKDAGNEAFISRAQNLRHITRETDAETFLNPFKEIFGAEDFFRFDVRTPLFYEYKGQQLVIYTDVLAIHRNGHKIAVIGLRTPVTQAQAKLVTRLASRTLGGVKTVVVHQANKNEPEAYHPLSPKLDVEQAKVALLYALKNKTNSFSTPTRPGDPDHPRPDGPDHHETPKDTKSGNPSGTTGSQPEASSREGIAVLRSPVSGTAQPPKEGSEGQGSRAESILSASLSVAGLREVSSPRAVRIPRPTCSPFIGYSRDSKARRFEQELLSLPKPLQALVRFAVSVEAHLLKLREDKAGTERTDQPTLFSNAWWVAAKKYAGLRHSFLAGERLGPEMENLAFRLLAPQTARTRASLRRRKTSLGKRDATPETLRELAQLNRKESRLVRKIFQQGRKVRSFLQKSLSGMSELLSLFQLGSSTASALVVEP